MDDFKGFVSKYIGAILGGLVALILACTGLYRIIVGIVLVCIGIWAGNYIQNNKEDLKIKLKNFIDKL